MFFLNFVKNLRLLYHSFFKSEIKPKNSAQKIIQHKNTPEPAITPNTVPSMSQPLLDSTLGLSSSSSSSSSSSCS